MPKTGSQTIEATLQCCSLPHQIFRFHYLSPATGSKVSDVLKSDKTDEAWKQIAKEQMETADLLLKTIRVRKILRWCGMPIPKLEIISGVRESIGLALSSIFQNYRYFAHDVNGLTVEVCRKALMRPAMFTALENWFDQELGRFFDIDVFRTVFRRQKGYAFYENHHARVMVYRFEALPSLPKMLHEFLGCEVPEVIHRNVGSSKGYADQYAYVREHLHLPAALIEEKYSTPTMKHFYSNRERRAFALRWSEGDQSPTTELSHGHALFQ
ncbi:MAG TPA: putative capsular polysaccharide synthesis family protein [Verrucomicrobiae bacterium]|nr:putative capsular polysaccharide synthesis family protein [Verrucomicrobiae bacterium]